MYKYMYIKGAVFSCPLFGLMRKECHMVMGQHERLAGSTPPQSMRSMALSAMADECDTFIYGKKVNTNLLKPTPKKATESSKRSPPTIR